MKRKDIIFCYILFSFILGIALLFIACEKEDNIPDEKSNVLKSNGIVLNGTGYFIEIHDANHIDLVSSFSIEVWINPNDVSVEKNIIGKQWCKNQWSYNLSIVDGVLKWVWN